MMPVAISNIYSLTCVSQMQNQTRCEFNPSIKYDVFDKSWGTKWSCHILSKTVVNAFILNAFDYTFIQGHT